VEYRITIAVDKGAGSESSSGKGSGHAWIALQRLENGKPTVTTTRGLWKDGYAADNGKGHDIRENKELRGWISVSRSAIIAEDAMRAVIADSRRDVTYSEVSNNCADFAAREWRIATGQVLRTSSGWTFGISTPGALGASLERGDK
jgi:hypothetical protein